MPRALARPTERQKTGRSMLPGRRRSNRQDEIPFASATRCTRTRRAGSTLPQAVVISRLARPAKRRSFEPPSLRAEPPAQRLRPIFQVNLHTEVNALIQTMKADRRTRSIMLSPRLRPKTPKLRAGSVRQHLRGRFAAAQDSSRQWVGATSARSPAIAARGASFEGKTARSSMKWPHVHSAAQMMPARPLKLCTGAPELYLSIVYKT